MTMGDPGPVHRRGRPFGCRQGQRDGGACRRAPRSCPGAPRHHAGLGAGGEDFDGISPALFAARAAGGDFALHWQAHGLFYGIPREVHQVLARGQDALGQPVAGDAGAGATGLSHAAGAAHHRAARGAGRPAGRRGREGRGDIARRLARAAPPFPPGLPVSEIDNSGRLDRAVAAALAALYPRRCSGGGGETSPPHPRPSGTGCR
jgi:ribose 1,5-bisphosphokinase